MPDFTVAAGKLRHRVEVYTRRPIQDPTTGIIKTGWDLLGYVYAAVEPVSVKEFVAAGANQSTVDTRITIRYRAGIDATCRVVFRNQAYSVQGVLPDPISGRDYLTLACSRGAIDG